MENNKYQKNRGKFDGSLEIKASTLSKLIITLTSLLGLSLTAFSFTKAINLSEALSNILNSVGVGLISASLVSFFLDKIWNKLRSEETKNDIQPILDKMNDVKERFEMLEGRIAAFKQVGLNFCHGNRAESLSRFFDIANKSIEIANEKKTKTSIKIVASSARGLVGFFDRDVDEDIHYKWRDLIDKNGDSFQILLTHPAYAHLRQPAEERSNGAIETEILKSALHFLLVARMNSNHLRFYRGSPTVFMVQVDKEVLINPYPYGNMAMKTLCLEFTGYEESGFINQFTKSHFDHTWAFLDQDDKIIDGKPFVEGIESLESIENAIKECTYLCNNKRLRLTELQVKSLDTFIERKILSFIENNEIVKNWGSFVERLKADGYSFCIDNAANCSE
jgi:hypothetical protein